MKDYCHPEFLKLKCDTSLRKNTLDTYTVYKTRLLATKVYTRYSTVYGQIPTHPCKVVSVLQKKIAYSKIKISQKSQTQKKNSYSYNVRSNTIEPTLRIIIFKT